MARHQSKLLTLIFISTVLTGCVTVACNPDDPKFGKDCYECTRKATLEAQQADPHTGSSISINDRTEDCLRERGYVKQKILYSHEPSSASPLMQHLTTSAILGRLLDGLFV